MKTKLTVTVESDVVRAAKRYAHGRGVSLSSSSLIESSLKEMANGEDTSFAERWRGQFRAASRDDPRYKALVRKYV